MFSSSILRPIAIKIIPRNYSASEVFISLFFHFYFLFWNFYNKSIGMPARNSRKNRWNKENYRLNCYIYFFLFCINPDFILSTEKILVTAALPYANGPIHLGHLSGAYLPADIYVRYQRLRGSDIIFVCGSDEHGVPITISADKEDIKPQQIIDRYHNINKEAFEQFGMSFDIYSRTSLPIHHEHPKSFFLSFITEDC